MLLISTDNNTMTIELINICSEQSHVFIGKLLDLTKEMHVSCQKNDFDSLNTLLNARSDYMQRIDKCSHLIDEIVSKLSQTEQATILDVISGTFTQNTCPKQYSTFLSVQNKSNSDLSEIQHLNQQISHFIQERQKELISLINKKKPSKFYTNTLQEGVPNERISSNR